MNIYINLFSIVMFLMSMYIVYAGISISESKQSYILMAILIITIILKLLYLIDSDILFNLSYMYGISVIVLMLQINFKKDKEKLLYNLNIINIWIILSSPIINILSQSKLYLSIAMIYTFIVCMYITYIKFKNKDIHMKVVALISTIFINMIIVSLIRDKEYITLITSSVDLISSTYIFSKILELSVINVNIKLRKVNKNTDEKKLHIKMLKEKIEINKNISNKINKNIYKKQDLLDKILGQCNHCTFIIDHNGYILSEDKSFNKMWKVYANNKYQINLIEFLNDNIRNSNQFVTYINEVQSKNIELKLELKSKDDRILECILAPFEINNKAIGIICAMTDITYKKNSEIIIAENDTKYKKIVDNIPYSILIADEENILYNNNKSIEIDFNNNDIKSMVLNKYVTGEVVCNSRENKKLYLNVDKISLDEQESNKSIVAIRDITEYKQLVNKLKYSKEKYESLVNVIPEGIYISNFEDKSINYSNNAYKYIIGDNDINKNNISKNMLYNEDINFVRKTIKNSKNKIINIEHGEMVIEVNKKVKRIGIVRDITQQVKAENIEREIEAKKKENEIKTQFFINMSHELKTPINVITSANQLLEITNKNYIVENPNSEIDKCVDIVKKHTYMLMGLINNIIDLAKIESQFYENDTDYYNIVNIIEDVCDEFNRYIESNNIQILFDTDEEERIANVDPNDIEKIILTLLSMVIRYSYKDSEILVNMTSLKKQTIINIQNKGGYDYNKYINDKERKNLNIGLNVAKSMLKLYNGKLEIKMGSKSDINITIEIETNEGIVDYKNRVISISDNSIYTEYLRLCNF